MTGKQFAITGAALLGVVIMLGKLPGGFTAESLGEATGSLLMPMFNAHLFTKYIDSKWIKENTQVSMIGIGLVSIFMNAALIFLIILIAMAVSHFTSKKKQIEI